MVPPQKARFVDAKFYTLKMVLHGDQRGTVRCSVVGLLSFGLSENWKTTVPTSEDTQQKATSVHMSFVRLSLSTWKLRYVPVTTPQQGRRADLNVQAT